MHPKPLLRGTLLLTLISLSLANCSLRPPPFGHGNLSASESSQDPCLLNGAIGVDSHLWDQPIQESIILPNGSLFYSTGINMNGGIDMSYRLTSCSDKVSRCVSEPPPMSSCDYDPPTFKHCENDMISCNGLDRPCTTIPFFHNFLNQDCENCDWISSFSSLENVEDIVLGVETILDLTGVNLQDNHFSLVGYWLSDNDGLDILVNGIPTHQTNSGVHAAPIRRCENRFKISSSDAGLIEGRNRIEFRWGNGGAAPDSGPYTTCGNCDFQGRDPTGIQVGVVAYLLRPCLFCDDFETGRLCPGSSAFPRAIVHCDGFDRGDLCAWSSDHPRFKIFCDGFNLGDLSAWSVIF